MSSTAAARASNYPQLTDVHDMKTGENFSLAQVGRFAELTRYAIRHQGVGQTFHGKVFLQEILGLTGMEISLGVLPPNTSFPFYHKHQQNEEVYMFLSGEGDYQCDGESTPIREGSVVRVAPNGVRAHRNTSSEPMVYICIQAKAGSLEQWTGTDGVGVPLPVTWSDAK
jgi:mannose-6-phosphate isomerase-like protein (cupin superfamily)